MDIAIIDVQGFFVHKSNKKQDFVLKEICVFIDNKYIHHIVSSPYHYSSLNKQTKKQIYWLQTNHHGLNWESGNTSWTELRSRLLFLINLHVKTIYVKGENKIQWIKELFDDSSLNVINMENFGCTISLHKPTNLQPCEYHTQRKKNINIMYHCALQNVQQLRRWYFSIKN